MLPTPAAAGCKASGMVASHATHNARQVGPLRLEHGKGKPSPILLLILATIFINLIGCGRLLLGPRANRSCGMQGNPLEVVQGKS
jgi:hypothetical protein